MDSKFQKFFYPLSVVAAIVAIWFALRKQAPQTTVVQEPAPGGNLTLPPVPPLDETLYYPGGSPAGSGVGTDPAYVSAASGDPYSFSPTVNVNVPLTTNVQYDNYPPKLVSNLPPWKNGLWGAPIQQLLAAGVPASAISTGPNGVPPKNPTAIGSGGGCGGGCSGCSGGSGPKCGAPRQTNKLLDGSTACFAPLYSGAPIPSPQVQILGALVESSYSNGNPQSAGIETTYDFISPYGPN